MGSFDLRRTMPILAAAMSLATSCALAADLPPAPILDDSDDGPGSGWYLRGDIGGTEMLVHRRTRDLGFESVPAIGRPRVDRGFTLGGGIGYQFGSWLRAEIAIDEHFAASYRGGHLGLGGATGIDRGDFSATTFMANAYLDLPLVSGITPYVGAGIGLSRNRIAGAERWVYGAGGELTGVAALGSHTNTTFVWALMAGVAFDLTSHLKLDLGYRYTRLGDARTRFGDDATPIRVRAIDGHEVRIGARYVFD